MTALRRTLLAAVGVAGVAVAAGAVVGLAPASVVGAASALDATLATGLVAAALVGCALRQRRRTEPADGSKDDGAGAADVSVADPGQPVDGALDRIDEDAAFAGEARERVRERIRATAVRAVARRGSASAEAAEAAVDAGKWTDDPVAAAFLGDERAPRYPLRERLRGWVDPDRAFRRRAARAVDAVYDVATEGSP